MKKMFLAAVTALALCSYSYAQDDEYEDEYGDEFDDDDLDGEGFDDLEGYDDLDED